jgi:N utilization substance protein A
VNELHGEKIDVVQWSKDPATYISNSLNPSSVMRVDLDAGTQSAVAVVPDRQLSLAIGKEGQNARLSARLTGWNVDIKSNIDVEAAQEVAQPEPPVSDVVQEAEAIVTEQTKEPAVETPSEPSIHLETEDVVEESLGTVEEVEPRVAEVEESASVESQVVEIEETGLVEVAPAVEQPAFTNIVPEVLIPELEETEPEKPTVAAESTSIQDLPEDVWSIRRNTPSAPGVIRFAEDIDELRGFGARRGRGGGRKGGQGGRKKSKAGRRR